MLIAQSGAVGLLRICRTGACAMIALRRSLSAFAEISLQLRILGRSRGHTLTVLKTVRITLPLRDFFVLQKHIMRLTSAAARGVCLVRTSRASACIQIYLSEIPRVDGLGE